MRCAEKRLYVQPDFKKSLGLWLLGATSALTFVFFYYSMNWWVVWSPMFFMLVVDRLLSWTSPLVLICYRCDTIHRGVPKAECQKFEAFDLEVYDRYRYAEQQSSAS